MCNSDSDLDGDEDNPYIFSDARSSRNNTNPELTQIKMMVQQQQAVMRAILTNQETIQERQTLHEEKVTQLEGRLVQHSTPSSSDGSPNTVKKRKRIVNRGMQWSQTGVLAWCEVWGGTHTQGSVGKRESLFL